MALALHVALFGQTQAANLDSETLPPPAAVAPTLQGPSGLIRLVTTDVGAQHTFRVALRGQWFTATDFLVVGDDHTRALGNLSVTYTPWEYGEVFFNLRGSSNRNERTDPTRVDDEMILAIGDIAFGGKLRLPVTNQWDIGLQGGAWLLNGVDSVGPEWSATSGNIGLLSSLDFVDWIEIPLRLHVNVGYFFDNSGELKDFTGYPLASLQVEQFSLGINQPRIQSIVGIDCDLRRYLGFGLTPLVEFALDVAPGSPDPIYGDPSYQVPLGPLTPDDLEGRLSAWITLGVRINPVAGLFFDLAADLPLIDPGHGFGPPLPPWNFIFGFGYAYDPLAKREVAVAPAPPPPPSITGTVHGRVRDAATDQPVPGAVIHYVESNANAQIVAANGTFTSYPFAPGRLLIEVQHPNYQFQRAEVDVVSGQVAEIAIALPPLTTTPAQVTPVPVPVPVPTGSQLRISIVDHEGAGVAATIQLSGPSTVTLKTDASGQTASALPNPGMYAAEISADDYLTRRTQVDVPANGTATLNVSITPKPKRSLVAVTKTEIVIKQNVHFVSGKADLMPDSLQLLDEVGHVMLTQTEGKRVEIQGHTDDRGPLKRNMELSQERAETVRNYLIGVGVDAAMLEARGYGPTQPKLPNFTARNRARNRRVEFKIIP